MPSSTGRRINFSDLDDQNGIRGISAVWIMMFHCFIYSVLGWNLLGSTLVPLFYLLSGYSLAIGYTGRMTKPIDSSSTPKVSLLKFYYNRVIRVMPVYYICFLFAMPIGFYGYGKLYDPSGSLASTLIVNILPVSSWFIFQFGSPFDGPEWTVATLLFFWLLFPWLIRHYEKKSDAELLRVILVHFWIQLIIVVVLFPVLLPYLGYAFSFWLTTGFPPFRFPVFVMGLAAGLLYARYPTKSIVVATATIEDSTIMPPVKDETIDSSPSPSVVDEPSIKVETIDSNAPSSIDVAPVIVETINSKPSSPSIDDNQLPWFNCSGYFLPFDLNGQMSNIVDINRPLTGKCCHAFHLPSKMTDRPIIDVPTETGVTSFYRIDFVATCHQQSIMLLVFTLFLAAIETFVYPIACNAWFQSVNVFAQLDLVVALCRSGPQLRPRITGVLRHPVANWLGEISMSLYLCHWPIIYYICWAVQRGQPATWPPSFNCNSYSSDPTVVSSCQQQVNQFNSANTMPGWGIVVVPCIAIPLAAGLYYLVEEPIRKYCK